jgi:hypothetical protein
LTVSDLADAAYLFAARTIAEGTERWRGPKLGELRGEISSNCCPLLRREDGLSVGERSNELLGLRGGESEELVSLPIVRRARAADTK